MISSYVLCNHCAHLHFSDPFPDEETDVQIPEVILTAFGTLPTEQLRPIWAYQGELMRNFMAFGGRGGADIFFQIFPDFGDFTIWIHLVSSNMAGKSPN